jgi:hypothetical protein
MVTGEDFGLTAVTAHLFMTMKSNLKMHGDRHRMVSNKIQELSDSDLTYLEKLLGEQFAKELEADQTWTQKNKYDRPGNRKKQIIKLMDAVRSQKRLTNVAKW